MQTSFFSPPSDPPDLHSFPTRRSSDLESPTRWLTTAVALLIIAVGTLTNMVGRRVLKVMIVLSITAEVLGSIGLGTIDRKSTRLNSSHGYISYAVFCLNKKRNSSLLPV